MSDYFCTFLQESAKAAAELARDFAPDIECKWGDAGLEEIMGDSSIMGVAIVLAGQVQVGVRVPTPKRCHSMIHYCLVHYTIT